MERKIKKIVSGINTTDGAGVHLKRVFGFHQIPLFDPYLMLDFFNSKNPADYTKGFPWHPHRGIETITFLFEGNIEHQDSLGNKGIINGGDCQWMTAGSGIIHQELPLPSESMLGIQLWANLPANMKMTAPKYKEIKSADVPLYQDENSSIRVIAGEYKSYKGLVQREDIGAVFLDVQIDANSEFVYDTIYDHKVFALLVKGSAVFSGEANSVNELGSAILYDKGDSVRITSNEEGARFLLVSGKPINEPIAWGGPIVMNTQEELDTAFKEYDNGTFIKQQ